MCGINGFISDKFSEEKRRKIVQKMNATLAHRGPDNDGIWEGSKICLGHRRLSIIDLSAESNQPFFSNDNRYVIVYNGELYNYKELKLDLQRSVQGSNTAPYFFKTNSDTEVILAAYLRWGNKCLDFFNGMYAFAIYDTQQEKLIVARDRIGVKPLYYYFGDEGFIFSSEIRPIIHSGVKRFALNKDVLAEYAMYQTVMAPNTMIKGVKMLMPGHLLEFENEKATITKYYHLNKITDLSKEQSYTEICKNVHDLLAQSVQRRLVADVPFGAFLSGGIDSSAIVGLMSKVSAEKIQTFNISFDESEFSESKYARIIATKFNTQHHEIKLSPDDFLKQLPEALSAMDHPSGDGPNTYIVSKATKNAGVTMALSGIGGDEVFAGYDVFKRMADLQNKSWLNAMPRMARRAAGYAIQKKRKSVSGNKIQELLSEEKINFTSAYPLNRSLFTKTELNKLIKDQKPFKTIHEIIAKVPQIENHLLSSVSLAEINTYLQNTLLRDTDQMSMAVALEVREPFLDYKLIEYVLGVNDQEKYPHTPKKLLVDSLGDLLPNEIVNRPKMGFTLPWQHWMKNELKDFCQKHIEALEQKKLFINGSLNGLWNQFLNGETTVSWSRIWHLIVLNNWMEENKIEQ
jgi:asparagine synthase (glutamine-hydrolysing)